MKVLFTCPICRETYFTHKQAQKCLDQPLDTGQWKVGDIVLVPADSHGWTEGDKNIWLAFSVEPDPEHIKMYHSWYVITHIARGRNHPHRAIMTLATGLYSRKGEIIYGWTPTVEKTHYEVFAWDNIPERARKYWRLPKAIKPPSEKMKAIAKKLAAENFNSNDLI